MVNPLRFGAIILFGLIFSFASQQAVGHQLSTGYLNLEVQQQQPNELQGQLQIRLFDLESAVGIDSNLDGQLLWSEVQARRNELNQYLLNNLAISANSQPCKLGVDPVFKAERHFNEGYLVADFIANCPQEVVFSPLAIRYSAVFPVDDDHKLLVNLVGHSDNTSLSAVIDSEQQFLAVDPQRSYALDTFYTYIYQGMVHIFIGLDHILFLVALLLTCVLYREAGEWYARSSLTEVLKTTAWVVTAFTLAHSITLTATALGWIALSSRWIELGIAVSVLLTALNNVWPVVLRLGWITFAFGLLHGMGFASVLGELGLSSEHTLVSIIGFNLGVEFGQLCILAAILPVLYLFRHFRWYQVYVVKIGSIAIGIAALNWSIQRF